MSPVAALDQSRVFAALHERDQLAVHADRTALVVLGVLGTQPDDAGRQGDAIPGQGLDLAIAPTRQVAEERDRSCAARFDTHLVRPMSPNQVMQTLGNCSPIEDDKVAVGHVVDFDPPQPRR